MADVGPIRVATSHLVIIDVQDRLTLAMDGFAAVEANLQRLIAAARILGVPMTATEQYPKGLGATIASLAEAGSAYPKMTFSCFGDEAIRDRLLERRRDLVLCGIEAHVCVLQTALDGLIDGLRVIIVADAVTSRTKDNKRFGLERLAAAGAVIATTEMVLFEWLGQAGTEEFRAVSRLIR